MGFFRVILTVLMSVNFFGITLYADGPVAFDRDVTYVYAIPNCKPGGFINCSRFATFRKDGTASVVLTDIMNAGTYQIRGDQIDVKFVTSGDSGEQMTFVLSKSHAQIKAPDSTIWVLKTQ